MGQQKEHSKNSKLEVIMARILYHLYLAQAQAFRLIVFIADYEYNNNLPN